MHLNLSPFFSPVLRTLVLTAASLSLSGLPADAAAPAKVKTSTPEVPQMTTPWDLYGYIKLGDSYEGSLDWSWEETHTFSSTGLPPGLVLDPATGAITGTPTRAGTYTVNSKATAGSVQSAVSRKIIIGQAHLPAPGTYEALLESEPGRPLAGHVTITVQPAGGYSGSLRIGTKTVSLAGTLRPLEGNPHSSISARFKFPRVTGTPDTAVFFSGSGGEPSLQTVDPEDGTLLATVDLTLVRPATGYATPCPQEGRHTVGFVSGGVKGSDGRFGNGFGTATFGKDYRLTFVGQSPEGKGLTASCWSHVPMTGTLFSLFYTSDNASTAIWGDVSIPSSSFGFELVNWARQPQSGRVYPDGIDQTPLQFLTSRMTPETLAAGFPSRDYRLVVSALEEVNESDNFTLTPRYQALFGTGSANPLKARLDLYAPTGFFTGQFTLSDPDPANSARTIVRTVHYRGIFLPEIGIGVGNFLIPTLPDPDGEPPTTSLTSPILCGSVRIENIRE